RFSREALWFPPELGTTAGPLENHRWRVFQGDGGDQLDPIEFYRRVGREDLVDGYLHRRRVAITTFVASGVAFLAADALLAKMANTGGPDCSVASNLSACIDADTKARADARSTYLPAILTLMAASFVGLGVTAWYGSHLQPISEREAKSLADQYNQGLRRNL